MERQIEECAQLIGDEADKCLMVGHPHKAVTEDTETLVHPEPGHGRLRVMVITVGPQQALKYLGRGRERGRVVCKPDPLKERVWGHSHTTPQISFGVEPLNTPKKIRGVSV